MSQTYSKQSEKFSQFARQSLVKITDEALTRICYDHFLMIYENFRDKMSRSKKDDMLIRHCEEGEEIDRLMRLLSPRSDYPFHVGGPVPPEKFIGHRRALDWCRTRLMARQPVNIAVSGQRRIGKTSLLHYLEKYSSTPDWGSYVSLFVDCTIFGGTLTSSTFWGYILNLLQDRLPSNSLMLPLIGSSARPPALTNQYILHLIKSYYQIHPQHTLILMIDEFELIFKTYNEDIENLLMGLRMLANDRKIVLLTATRTSLSDACIPFRQQTDIDFDGNFVSCPLKLFDWQETQHVAETLFDQAGTDLTEQEMDYIWRRSQWEGQGAFPLFVQLAASLIFEYKKYNPQPINFQHLERDFLEQTDSQRNEILGHKDYERGLKLLENLLPLDDSSLLLNYYRLAKDLQANLHSENQSGATPRLQTVRNLIIEELTDISRQVTNLSFDQLASGQQPG